MKRNENPGGRPGQKQKTEQASPSYPAAPVPVKFLGEALRCGRCRLFRSGPDIPRRHCASTGQTTWPGKECHLDPLSPALAWVDALPVGGGL